MWKYEQEKTLLLGEEFSMICYLMQDILNQELLLIRSRLIYHSFIDETVMELFLMAGPLRIQYHCYAERLYCINIRSIIIRLFF